MTIRGNHTTRKAGFTLVEVAIVLVIVGLLIGGILIARSLIDSSKVKAATQQIGQYDISIENFQQRFRSLPGDSTKFGDGSVARNNNGKIESLTGTEGDGSTFAGEVAWFWKDLEAASGGGTSRFTPTITGNIKIRGTSVNIPPARFGSGHTGVLATNDYYTPATQDSLTERKLSGAYLFGDFEGVTSDSIAIKDVIKGSITPANALALDKKLDNGIANTGAIIALPETASCITNTTEYNVASKAEVCALAIGYLRIEEAKEASAASNNGAPASCGDGIVNGVEECDGTPGCDGSCHLDPCYGVTCNSNSCEQCNSSGVCESICQGVQACVNGVCLICGNGNIDVNEQCDDGNATDGDGCSSSCQTECNYNCGGSCTECQTCNSCTNQCTSLPDNTGCSNGGVCTGGTCGSQCNMSCSGCGECQSCDTCTGSCINNPNGNSCSIGTCQNGTCTPPCAYTCNNSCGECTSCNACTDQCDGITGGSCASGNGTCSSGTCVCNASCGVCAECQVCNPCTATCETAPNGTACTNNGTCNGGTCINQCLQTCSGGCGECQSCDACTGTCVPANENGSCSGNTGSCIGGACVPACNYTCNGGADCGECTACDSCSNTCVPANEYMSCNNGMGTCTSGSCI